MEHVNGKIYKDYLLTGLEPSQRRAIYEEMNKTLANLHKVDIKAANLEDYGKQGK